MGRAEPAQRPAQHHDPGPVADPQVRGRQRRRPVHGQVQGPVRDRRPPPAERVDHDHQVGRPFRGSLVHVQLAAADAHRPVHVPQLVAGLRRGGCRRTRCPSPTARPVCSPIRRSSSAGTSRGRIRAGRGKTSSRIRVRPGSAPGRRPGRPAVTRTAPGGYRPHRSGRTTHWSAVTSASCRNTCAARPGDQRDPRARAPARIDDLVQRAPAGRADRRGDRHVLALEAARPGQRHGPRPAAGGAPARHQRQRPQGRGGQQDQRGVPGHDRGQQREQRRRGQVPGRGRPGAADRAATGAARRGRRCDGRTPFHGGFAGRARWPGPRAATSSPVTCRTHISGRRTRRWASAGTATALMSSGVTNAAAGQRGVAAGQLDHRQRAARRGAHRDLRVGPGGGDQRDHVRRAGPGAAARSPATPAWPAAGRRR